MGEGLRFLVESAAKHFLGPHKKSYTFLFAGPRGIEPRPTVLETDVLPLNYRPSARKYSMVRVINK